MGVPDEQNAGTIQHALWNASNLLWRSPELALEQTSEILRAAPGHPGALLLSCRAHRWAGDPDGAEHCAQSLIASRQFPGKALRELGLVSLLRDDRAKAIDFLNRATASNRNDAGAWAMIAELLKLAGDEPGAASATLSSIAASVHDEECLAPALALSENRLSDAEHLLRIRLRDFPTEVASVRMMAELATRLGRMGDAEKLLRRALQIAPDFHAARELLARNLQRTHRPSEALAEVDALIAKDPSNPSFQMLKASLLVKVGDQETARIVYLKVLEAYPNQPKGWLSLGHVLKTLGRRDEGIVAYRHAIDQQPTLGEAWWSLANLKTVRFTPDDVTRMTTALRRTDNDDDKLHLHFALGKASEDAAAYDAAFDHWTKGNMLRRKSLDYSPDETHQACVNAIATFDIDTLTTGGGHEDGAPIFVVGMPRSGSTLVEQILASHSQIEGTMELPDMMDIASRLAVQAARRGEPFPACLKCLSADERISLGQEYLDRTRVHRKTDRPYFIDKMPNNWLHVGLIKLILPNAQIIDTRRHPVGCCLSMWKQHFARGQGFSYDLEDLARYYSDYAGLMEHFAFVAPNMIHRVYYEQMVSDSESQIRSLIARLGLPFEDACLSFWKTDRAVRTASSEQVRTPIFTDAVEHWRQFESRLAPLVKTLGPLVDRYPALPRDLAASAYTTST